MLPRISVVLPTYQRARHLAVTLAALSGQQAAPPWELIVIDNDPEGSARTTVERAGVPATYVIEGSPGASHARNRGIAASSGEVLAMLDDDVVPAPTWLAELTRPIVEGRADVTGGPVHLDPDVPRPPWFEERIVGMYLTNFDLGGGERVLGDDEYVVTANAAFRAEIVRRTGGFDPVLGPRGNVQLVGDDVQFVRQCRRLGATVRWVPSARVVHELPANRLRPRWILRRAWLQGRTDWLIDREELERRRWNGARVAANWLADELRGRFGEGVRRPEVAFHALCDLARTSGRLREAVGWALRPRSSN